MLEGPEDAPRRVGEGGGVDADGQGGDLAGPGDEPERLDGVDIVDVEVESWRGRRDHDGGTRLIDFLDRRR